MIRIYRDGELDDSELLKRNEPKTDVAGVVAAILTHGAGGPTGTRIALFHFDHDIDAGRGGNRDSRHLLGRIRRIKAVVIVPT